MASLQFPPSNYRIKTAGRVWTSILNRLGFVGNVVLKVSESIADVIGKLLKQKLKENPITMLGALIAKPAFDALKKEIDYAEQGGAPLLGINGTCIICHGGSNARAIKNAIRVSGEFVKYEINQHIVEALQNSKE